MSASYTMRATEDYLTYNDLVGENLDGNNTQSVKYQVESQYFVCMKMSFTQRQQVEILQ